MSPVPKIGRTPVNTEKSEMLRIADDLAAKARILRREAKDHEALLDRLRDLGNEHAKHLAQEENARRNAQTASIAPLLRQANGILLAGDEARREAKMFLQQFDTIKFDVLRDRFPASHGVVPGSDDSTRNRIARLRTQVEELRQIVEANDGDLRAVLKRAGELEEVERASSRHLIEQLRVLVQRGGSADGVRAMVRAIRHLLNQIGQHELPEVTDPVEQNTLAPSPTVLLGQEDVNAFAKATQQDTSYGHTSYGQEAK
jgi:hypothetical protein